MQQAAVPSFYLYGEPPRAAELAFVHVEPLDDRSRPSEWTIAPHRHDGLAHLMLICAGDGTAFGDGAACPFRAPALVIVPARLIHGFAWAVESRGHVVTVAVEHLATLGQLHAEAAALFGGWAVRALPAEAAAGMEQRIRDLARHLNWDRPGRMLAVNGMLLALIAEAWAHLAPAAPPPPASRAARLVARFRERIEQCFRQRPGMAVHARALGVSVSTLRAACVAVAGVPPLRIQDERTMLEARRLLRYSSLTIAEIGDALGFADPAHFSRFFKRMDGAAPQRARLIGASGG